jgi:hypothetical protein
VIINMFIDAILKNLLIIINQKIDGK